MADAILKSTRSFSGGNVTDDTIVLVLKVPQGQLSAGGNRSMPISGRPVARAMSEPRPGYLLGCGVWQEIFGFTPM